MAEIINSFFILIFLLVCTKQDVKRRTIKNRTLILGGCISLIITGVEIYMGLKSLSAAVLGLLVGLASLAISFFSHEKLGMADAIILCICGSLTGVENVMTSLIIALLLAAFLGGIVCLIKKRSLKQEIPFVPFLLAGFIVLTAINSDLSPWLLIINGGLPQ